MYRTWTLTLLTLAGFAAACVGQSPENYDIPPGPFHQPTPPYPVEMGFSQDHSSTAAEGYLRGKAALIQAHGNFQLSESQAQILRQQARWLDRENDLKQTAALNAQKQMWADARAKERIDRNAAAKAGRQLAEERAATVYRRAYQLSADDINPTNGGLRWPAALQGEKFASQRAEIEQLFVQYVMSGGNLEEVAVELTRRVNRCAKSLRGDSKTLPREEYNASQKFLLGLKYTSAETISNIARNRTMLPGNALATQ
jgi:hypothetical protein